MKRYSILFLCVVFILSFAGARDVSLLNVASYSTSPANIYPGDTVALIANIASTSSGIPATGVGALISLNEAYFEPINLTEDLGTINAGESRNAVFRFKVKDDAYSGTYNFSVVINYKNMETSMQKSEDVNINIVECYSLDVGNIYLNNYSPHIGEVFSIRADVTNTCSGEARDVLLKLKPVTNTTLSPFIAVSDTVLKIGNIPPRTSKKATFNLRVSDKAEPQAYVFSIDANCLDCGETDTETFSFEVFGEPNLIISGIDFSIDLRTDSKTIFSGDSLSLSIQLDNIGKETAKAVSMKIATGESIIGIKEGYIGNIDEDDSGAVVFGLTVSPLAEAGEHEIQIAITYLDELGTEQTVVKTFSLYITQRPPESPIGLLILIIIILILLYFVIKMVFRQLAMRKA